MKRRRNRNINSKSPQEAPAPPPPTPWGASTTTNSKKDDDNDCYDPYDDDDSYRDSSDSSSPRRASTASSKWMVYLLPLAVAWRIYLSVHLPIMDCDEVYNYWEPLHFVLMNRTSSAASPMALQTWEYANQYALRSYAFLMPLKSMGHLYLDGLEWLRRSHPSSSWSPLLRTWFVPSHSNINQGSTNSNDDDSIVLFFLLRSTIAIATTLAELFWFRTLALHNTTRSIKQPPRVVPRRVVTVMTLLALTLPGTNMISVSLLPSSAFAIGWLVASALLVRHRHQLVVLTVLLCTLTTGWPFGAAVFVPMAIRIVWLQYKEGGVVQVVKMAAFGIVMALVIQLLVCAIDGHYYHDDYLHHWQSLSPVLATWNIFQYNAVGGGDTIYGVEPLSYYLKNLLINLNFVAPLGAVALVVHGCSQRVNWDVWTCLASVVPWIMITFPRPHKEERFLFPIYYALVTGAAMVVDATLNALGRLEAGLSRHKCLSRKQRLALEVMVWGPVLLLGWSRTMALTTYYRAPLATYTALNAVVGPHDIVCTCGEWYRYPSTFFLGNTNQSLQFLPSSFVGQLPQPFVVSGSRPSSVQDLQPFRSDNGMNPERFSTLENCDWVVELKSGTGVCNVTLPDDDDAIVYRHPFLNAAATSTIHRVLYVPWWHEAAVRKGSVQYHEYVVYRINKNSKKEP